MNKWVYNFEDTPQADKTSLKNLLGGKGANLSEMIRIGLPVPPGFTITTAACNEFYKLDQNYPVELKDQVSEAIKKVETKIKKVFGDENDPLLVSVRSGARVSMPGMMDTVLNLGLNDKTVIGLAKKTNNETFAYDSYRRFIQMYSNVVLNVDHHNFEDLIENYKLTKGVVLDTELQAEDWKSLIVSFREQIQKEIGKDFPQDVHEQLWGAVGAVFQSWRNQRAKTYRKLNNIPEEWGTAVNVQSMVFGNMGSDCATGVAFTRNPSTGENSFYGEYLINAQGEDVVAGIRTPQNITKKARLESGSEELSMEESMPDVYQELVSIYLKLEKHYRDMQDIEFTVENKKLWMLQTRSGKRTAKAGIKIAVDMVEEKLINKDEALLRIDPKILDTLLHPTLDPKAKKDVIAKGLPASPGAASGKVTFTADDAETLKAQNQKTILVRLETSPEDIHGMNAAEGILTCRGGMTSHAAVVARGMGRPCVSGAGTIQIDYKAKNFRVGDREVKEGDIITIDGSTGEVMVGEVTTIKPDISGDFSTIMSWADEARTLKIRTNAETPLDTKVAREFGAEGIGLCRTEHMFFDEERILYVRQMILSKNIEDRNKALKNILPYQKKDFVEIFKTMHGLPVTVRLLDPPLHEFLPKSEKEINSVAKILNISEREIQNRIADLHEENPMLGHRGCRLAISYPEIYEMQCEAIFEALVECDKDKSEPVIPEIMIPLISTAKELEILKALVERKATEVQAKHGVSIKYLIGTMIEIPRAALNAFDIAKHADFFSFGTNDLTQTTLGISRDDSGKFLDDYVNNNIFAIDPFVSIDVNGVGQLVKLACEQGMKQNKNIKLGICGEHGGDPDSIDFCHNAGLNYVSCSPYRVPIARLAAAQAKIRASQK
ncbi:MAG: pyruvate, phosphate dikinase [Pelagibacteraceae bacterium]|jgi:pyruvate,orthophosphate dikinase|nr:pyruvate, phosphate dikinase [Pelagibacteraceae bacterium]